MASKDRISVAAIVVSQVAPPFMFSGVAVALPSMGVELDAGATTLGLVATVFLAGSLAFLLPLGRLADATDKRTIYKVALLLFAIVTAAIGWMSWIPGILALRFIQGVIAAAIGATGPALVADIVPPERRGRAYGALLGAVYAGLTLGPVCAGLLIRVASWRAVFFIGAGLLLLAFSLVALTLPSRWRRSTRSAQLPSAALIVVAVSCLVAGSATLRLGSLGIALLSAGVVLSIVFVLIQRRLEDPLLDVRALARHRIMRDALLVQLLVYMSAYCLVFMLSIYLQVSLGHSAEKSGLLLALASLLMAASAPVAGALSDRVSPRVIASLGVGSVLACTLMATQLGPQTSLAYVAVLVVLQGLGYGLFASPNMTIIMNSATAQTVGMASALSAKSRALGMILGMLVTVVLISWKLGDAPVEQHPAEFIEVVVVGFEVLALVGAVALLISVSTGRARSGEAQPG
ncbi:Efflux pump antibiotic resistance protein [Enhygromyxa salina]|uniref:Efflux pump antibiotic resistance protein n=1 Tax=Enhygromyxa salina TaxID=215803 RepID=A0A0C2A2W9_9BACT|nr:MFS transporter [Enhygromyxa salina]KIG17703.1 Efflux pump antibiotic resistance protein [Enhygromyxa salina]